MKEVEVREERGWVSGVSYREGVTPGDLEYCSVNILERILTPEVKEVEVREERGWVSGVSYREGGTPGDLEYCSVNTGENTNTRSEGSRGKRRERMG